jgi:hypothetical protein
VIRVGIEKPRGIYSVRSKFGYMFTDRRTQFADRFGKLAIFEPEEYRRRQTQNASGPKGVIASPSGDLGGKNTGNRKVFTPSGDESTQLPSIIAQ